MINQLHLIYRSYTDTQKLRKSYEQRGQLDFAEGLLPAEARLVNMARKTLKTHPLGPWLSEHKGFSGIRMAGVIGMLRDPHRFPGQCCDNEKGQHYFASSAVNAGDPCPEAVWDLNERGKDNPCTGIIGELRRGSGVRSVWHYSGLFPVDGKMVRHSKAAGQSSFRDELRTCFLMPNGIVDQVIKQRTLKYRDLYDEKKVFFFDRSDIAAMEKGRPARSHSLARVCVAKAILGDMLMEWKRLI